MPLGSARAGETAWARAQDQGDRDWGSDSRSSSQSRPGECRAQINSLHSSGTAARTQRAFLQALPWLHSLPSPSPFLSLFSVQPAQLPFSFPQPLKATEESFRVTPSSPSPHLPTLPPPQATGTARRRRGSPEALRACALGVSPRNNPAPPSKAPGRWDARVVRSWGKVRAFKGERPAPEHPPSAKARGHGVCARMARGGGRVGGGQSRGWSPRGECGEREGRQRGPQESCAALSDPRLPRESYPPDTPTLGPGLTDPSLAAL